MLEERHRRVVPVVGVGAGSPFGQMPNEIRRGARHPPLRASGPKQLPDEHALGGHGGRGGTRGLVGVLPGPSRLADQSQPPTRDVERSIGDIDVGALGTDHRHHQPAQHGCVTVLPRQVPPAARVPVAGRVDELDALLHRVEESLVACQPIGFRKGDDGNPVAVHRLLLTTKEPATALLPAEQPVQAPTDHVSIGTVAKMSVVGAEKAQQGETRQGDVRRRLLDAAALPATGIEVRPVPTTVGTLVTGQPVQRQGDGLLRLPAAAQLLEDLLALLRRTLRVGIRYRSCGHLKIQIQIQIRKGRARQRFNQGKSTGERVIDVDLSGHVDDLDRFRRQRGRLGPGAIKRPPLWLRDPARPTGAT